MKKKKFKHNVNLNIQMEAHACTATAFTAQPSYFDRATRNVLSNVHLALVTENGRAVKTRLNNTDEG